MPNQNRFQAGFDDFELELQFFSPEIVRVLKHPAGMTALPPPESFSVTMTPAPGEWKKTESDGTIRFESGRLRVELSSSGRVAFFSADGKTMFLAERECGCSFVPVQDVETPSFRVRQAFRLTRDEAIYGLGQHQTGRLNQRNQHLLLSQINMEIAIPSFLSTKGYGLFWDNASPTVFDDSPAETVFESQIGEYADYYFLGGGTLDRAHANLRELTGAAPIPPLWTLGYVQSKERYVSRYESVEVVRRHRELGIPLDGIVQDWQYWGGEKSQWNSMKFEEAFARPAEWVKELHAENAHLLISVWPNFGDATPPCRKMKEQGFLLPLGPTTDSTLLNYDAWNAGARDLFWQCLSEHLAAAGVDGWWLDASEPEQFFPHTQSMWGEPDPFDIRTAVGSFRRVRNSYPLVHAEGVAQHQRAASEDRRVVILTRSAFAGQQRTGSFCWSGDVGSTWEALRKQIPAGVNFSMSGLPYWNTDIGGFFGNREFPGGVTEPGFRELYVRWMQFALFTPMMRPHGTFSPREIWQFGSRGDWAFDAIESCIRLRYQLLPYLYSTAWRVWKHGETFLRPLAADDPENRCLYDIRDEFLFGPAFLVAPVTEPMYMKDGVADFSRTGGRRVLLPGGDWFDFRTGEKVSGECFRETPIELLPLFVKAGTILPLAPVMQYAGEKRWDDLEIRIYPGADGEFTLYDDAYDSYRYEQGESTEIRLTWNDAEHRLTIGAAHGNYPGCPATRRFRFQAIGGREQIVDYTGEPLAISL